MGSIITALSISSPSANTLNFDGSNFIVSEIKGLEFPVVRLPRYNLPGASGASVSNALLGERGITIKGTITVPDSTPKASKITTFLANRTTFLNALAFSRDASNVLSSQTLTITLANGQVLTTNVYVDKTVTVGFSPDQTDWEDFFISLVAPDPFLYSATQTTTVISLASGGGTPISTPIPMNIGAQSGGSAVINNIGSVAANPIITLSAPLDNPYIWNSRTGAFLNINYKLQPGDSALIIDCGAKTITQGVNNLYGVQSFDSTFWSILSGNNTIFFRASGGTGTATIAFFPVFIGI